MGNTMISGNTPAQIHSATATLGQRAFIQDWLHVIDTGGITLTLPTPDRNMLGMPSIFVNTASTSSIISAPFSSGVVSYTIGAGQIVQLVAVEYSAGSYGYGGLGGQATYTFTPSLAWTSATPTISAQVHRYVADGQRIKGVTYIACTDGLNATTLTMTFPTKLIPANVGQIIPCIALVSIGGAAQVSYPAYIDGTQAVAANRTLTVLNPTLTTANAATVAVHFEYERA